MGITSTKSFIQLTSHTSVELTSMYEWDEFNPQGLLTDITPLQIGTHVRQQPQYKSTGLLRYTRSEGGEQFEQSGTGFLVSADLLITSAHNVWNIKTDSPHSHLRFYPGTSIDIGKDKYYQPQRSIYDKRSYIMYVPQQYKHQGRNQKQYDYAFIKLSSFVPGHQWIKLGVNFKQSNEDIMTLGFGLSKKEEEICQRFSSGLNRITKAVQEEDYLYSKRFFHQVSSLPEGNGGPILLTGTSTVVGIQVGSSKRNGNNVARSITAGLAITLLLWAQKHEAQPFRVIDLNSNKELTFTQCVYQQIRSMLRSVEPSQLEQENIKLERQAEQLQLQNQRLQEQIMIQKRLREEARQRYFKQLSQKTNEIQKYVTLLNKESQKLTETNRSMKNLKENIHNLKQIDEGFKQQMINQECTINRQTQQINYLKEQLQGSTGRSVSSDPFFESLKAPVSSFKSSAVEWDKSTPFAASKFTLLPNKVTRFVRDSQCYQVTSKSPLPRQCTKIRFKIEQYGDKSSICVGLITNRRKTVQWSGGSGHGESVGYWTWPQTKKGWINIDGEQSVAEEGLFLQEGGVIEMTVELWEEKIPTICFKNELTEHMHQYPLSQKYTKKPVYLFISMWTKKDTVIVLSDQ